MRTCPPDLASRATLTPCPSCPKTHAQGDGSCMASSACPAWELVATIGNCKTSKSARSRHSCRKSPKCAPMPARSTLGDQSPAAPFKASTCLKPKAAALRNMDPTLPASCTRSLFRASLRWRIHADPPRGADALSPIVARCTSSSRQQRRASSSRAVLSSGPPPRPHGGRP